MYLVMDYVGAIILLMAIETFVDGTPASKTIPALDKYVSLGSLYSVVDDSFSPVNLFTFLENTVVVNETDGESFFQSYDFEASSDISASYSSNVEGEFNVLLKFFSAGVGGSSTVTNFGSFKSTVHHRLVKYERTSRFESINPCSSSMDRYINSEILLDRERRMNCQYAVTGKEYGVRIFILLRREVSEGETAKDVAENLKAGAQAVLKVIDSKLQGSKSNSSTSSQYFKSIRITFRTNVNIPGLLSEELGWEDMGNFMSKALTHVTDNPMLGRPLFYRLHSLDSLAECRAKQAVNESRESEVTRAGLDYAKEVAKLTSLRYSDVKYMKEELNLYKYCFSYGTHYSYLSFLDEKKAMVDECQVKLVEQMKGFRNGSVNETQFMSSLKAVKKTVLEMNPHKDDKEQSLQNVLRRFRTAASYKLQCLSPHEDADFHVMPNHYDSFGLFNDSDVKSANATGFFKSFSVLCSTQNLTCALVSCSLNSNSMCNDYSGMKISSSTLKSMELQDEVYLIKKSLEFLYRSVRLGERVTHVLDRSFVRAINFLYLQHNNSYKLNVTSSNTSMLLFDGCKNPIEALTGRKYAY